MQFEICDNTFCHNITHFRSCSCYDSFSIRKTGFSCLLLIVGISSFLPPTTHNIYCITYLSKKYILVIILPCNHAHRPWMAWQSYMGILIQSKVDILNYCVINQATVSRGGQNKLSTTCWQIGIIKMTTLLI